MVDVLQGFIVVIAVIGVGYLLARAGSLGRDGHRVLASFVYLVATPALIFQTMTTSEPEEIFNENFLVVVMSSLASGFAFFCLAKWVFKETIPESIIGMLASSYANAANIGVPLAVYILGDPTVVIPVMLFQIAFYGPISLTVLDAAKSRANASSTAGVGRFRRIATTLSNPLLIASIIAIIVMLAGIPVPEVIANPVEILAGASVPLALVVFGMSLRGASIRLYRDVVIVAIFKNLLTPLIAVAVAAWIFGMSGAALQSAAIIAALPTAQNVYTYALQFRTREELARDAGLVTTAISLPVMIMLSMINW